MDDPRVLIFKSGSKKKRAKFRKEIRGQGFKCRNIDRWTIIAMRVKPRKY